MTKVTSEWGIRVSPSDGSLIADNVASGCRPEQHDLRTADISGSAVRAAAATA